MTDWTTLINAAYAKGFRVSQGDDGWIITTPKAPRRPSQELGAFKNERDARHTAAFLASIE